MLVVLLGECVLQTEQKFLDDGQSFEQSINFMPAWPYFDPTFSEFFPPQPPVMMNACEVCGEAFGDALQLMTHRQSVRSKQLLIM